MLVFILIFPSLLFTFISYSQGHIVRNLEAASQEVPAELMELAMKSSWFKNSRFEFQHVEMVQAFNTNYCFFLTDSSEAKEVEEETGKKNQIGFTSFKKFRKWLFFGIF